MTELRRRGLREMSLEEFKMRAVAFAQAGDRDGSMLMRSLLEGGINATLQAAWVAAPIAYAPPGADPFAYARTAARAARSRQGPRLRVVDVMAAGGYAVVYADPPWQYDDQNCNGAAEQQYSSLSLAQLKALPVSQIAARDAALFMWATYPKIQDALDLIPHWGFTYKSYAFDWVKLRGGRPQMGLGRWFRGGSEVCLLAIRGRPERVDAGVRQLLETFADDADDAGEGRILYADAGRHSAKPPEARARIERLLGDVPRVELFARERVVGWDAWGNEVDSDIDL